jgi:hypothetical protein
MQRTDRDPRVLAEALRKRERERQLRAQGFSKRQAARQASIEAASSLRQRLARFFGGQ